MSNYTSAIAIEPAPYSVGRALAHPSGRSGTLRFTAAALLMPQIPALLWHLQRNSSAYFRGWVNTEYLLLLALALLFPSWKMIAALTLELAIALVEPIAHLYYFSTRDALFSMQYLLLLPLPRLVAYLLLLTAYLFGCVAMLRLSLGVRRLPQAKQMAAVAIVCAILPAVVDIDAGRFYKLHAGPPPDAVDVQAFHATRMPAVSLARQAWKSLLQRPGDEPETLSSTLSHAMAKLPSDDPPDIVLILTESWGLANDDRINQAELQPYRNADVASLYRIESGTASFKGGTTSGETRELCGDSIGQSSLAAPATFFAGCWPSRLASAGYRTLAAHGFTAAMFHRGAWYKRFGFQQVAFLPELVRDGASVCEGAFPGACDADVARWIGNQLVADRGPRPMFVHWVTLNSHLPIATLTDSGSLQNCAAAGIERDQGLCSWFAHVLIVQNSVAELARRPGLRPTLFVVVGDHAPPFLSTGNRDRFSQSRVPYVILTPRSVRSSIPSTETAVLHAASPATPAIP